MHSRKRPWLSSGAPQQTRKSAFTTTSQETALRRARPTETAWREARRLVRVQVIGPLCYDHFLARFFRAFLRPDARTRSLTPIFGSGGPRPSQTLPYASQTHTITIARASSHKASFFATFVLPSHAVVTTRGPPSELILVCFQGTLRVLEGRFSSRGCAPHPADGRGPAGQDSTHR